MTQNQEPHGKRIVIIDDDPVCLAAYRSVVRQCVPDVQIVEADDGVSAIAAVMAERPDLVLADLALPNVDGRRVIREMKASRSRYDVPVLVVSSVRLDGTDVHPLLSGVFHVPKPVVRDDLEAMICQCLSYKRVLPDFSPGSQVVERYAAFDLVAMEASVGFDRQCQLEVLSIFMDNVGRRLVLLDEIRCRRASFHEARVAAHGMLGSARMVGANRLAYRLDTLVKSLADDDQMLVELYSKESMDELETAARRVRDYLELLARNASDEILMRFRTRQKDSDAPS